MVDIRDRVTVYEVHCPAGDVTYGRMFLDARVIKGLIAKVGVGRVADDDCMNTFGCAGDVESDVRS